MRILFSSDIHGNTHHVETLLEAIELHKADYFLIGGDLCPRREHIIKLLGLTSLDGVIEGQLAWFRDSLIPILQKSPVPVFLICGNSDCRYNIQEFRRICAATKNVRFLNSEWVELPHKNGDSYWLLAYSYVPISHHRMKDWEIIDQNTDFATSPQDARGSTSPQLSGWLSDSGKIEPFNIQIPPKHTIEADLAELVSKHGSINAEKQVWMIHCPPFDTNIDKIPSGRSVGSIALKNAIEKHRPLVTLHGHIHETVQVSKTFYSLIPNGTNTDSSKRQSISFGVGNNFRDDNVYFILVDLDSQYSGQRLSLPSRGLKKSDEATATENELE